MNYGLLGHPLGHTMSPPIHKRLFELEGDSVSEYALFDIAEEQLDERVSELLALDGFNITIPHKGNIIKYLDELHDSAKRYTSVNCVSVKNGYSVGYNTDCDGFLRSIRAAGGRLDGSVLQCGCGGVGRMIAIEAVRSGAELTVSVVPGFENTVEPVREYAKENGYNNTITVVHPDEIPDRDFDTLINATPVGMFPKVEAAPVNDEVIKRVGFVFDVIYNPDETLLMKKARQNGITAVGGMAMLVWQAAVAHEYWTGAEYDNADIERIIKDMQDMMKNA